jgi:serine/threonine protein kinase
MRLMDHASVIQIKDVFATENKIFMVLELVEGGELFDKIVDKVSHSVDLFISLNMSDRENLLLRRRGFTCGSLLRACELVTKRASVTVI